MKKFIFRPCLQCNKNRNSNNKQFCSIICRFQYKYETFIKKWLNNEVDGIRGGVQTARAIKRYIKELRGEKCEICGWDERNKYTNLIPLHLDHIDGNYRNNKLTNLRLLCPNCHSLTSNYGSTNHGKGRPFYVIKKLAEETEIASISSVLETE